MTSLITEFNSEHDVGRVDEFGRFTALMSEPMHAAAFFILDPILRERRGRSWLAQRVHFHCREVVKCPVAYLRFNQQRENDEYQGYVDLVQAICRQLSAFHAFPKVNATISRHIARRTVMPLITRLKEFTLQGVFVHGDVADIFLSMPSMAPGDLALALHPNDDLEEKIEKMIEYFADRDLIPEFIDAFRAVKANNNAVDLLVSWLWQTVPSLNVAAGARPEDAANPLVTEQGASAALIENMVEAKRKEIYSEITERFAEELDEMAAATQQPAVIIFDSYLAIPPELAFAINIHLFPVLCRGTRTGKTVVVIAGRQAGVIAGEEIAQGFVERLDNFRIEDVRLYMTKRGIRDFDEVFMQRFWDRSDSGKPEQMALLADRFIATGSLEPSPGR